MAGDRDREARDVPIVGVGEGSAPQFARVMRRIGLDDADWMPAADATWCWIDPVAGRSEIADGADVWGMRM